MSKLANSQKKDIYESIKQAFDKMDDTTRMRNIIRVFLYANVVRHVIEKVDKSILMDMFSNFMKTNLGPYTYTFATNCAAFEGMIDTEYTGTPYYLHIYSSPYHYLGKKMSKTLEWYCINDYPSSEDEKVMKNIIKPHLTQKLETFKALCNDWNRVNDKQMAEIWDYYNKAGCLLGSIMSTSIALRGYDRFQCAGCQIGRSVPKLDDDVETYKTNALKWCEQGLTFLDAIH